MMSTEARRKASAALHKKRVEEGWRKVTFWLRPETVKKAESLRDQVGGIEAVVNQAVMDWQGAEPPKPAAKASPFEVRFEAPPTQSELSRAPKVSIQVGPPERKPGSLQKKGK